ncbi:MAG TPA: hypothetical protein P5307_04700, partial [Pirellulaceae bacterium]|nr:hypothetical protein [Pirellulaceae bacterium]
FEMRAVVRHWLQQHNRDMVGDTLVEYSRALEADPQNASLRMQRGWLLAKTQRQALEDFEVAINAADPAESNRITRALAHSGRAYVYAMEGYEDDAIAAAEQASALAPENEDVQFNAAIAYSLCVELAKRDPAQAASAGEYTDRAVILLKKSLEMRRNRDPQWNEKWRRLLAEPGFTAIRDDEGFKALLQ